MSMIALISTFSIAVIIICICFLKCIWDNVLRRSVRNDSKDLQKNSSTPTITPKTIQIQLENLAKEETPHNNPPKLFTTKPLWNFQENSFNVRKQSASSPAQSHWSYQENVKNITKAKEQISNDSLSKIFSTHSATKTLFGGKEIPSYFSRKIPAAQPFSFRVYQDERKNNSKPLEEMSNNVPQKIAPPQPFRSHQEDIENVVKAKENSRNDVKVQEEIPRSFPNNFPPPPPPPPLVPLTPHHVPQTPPCVPPVPRHVLLKPPYTSSMWRTHMNNFIHIF